MITLIKLKILNNLLRKIFIIKIIKNNQKWKMNKINKAKKFMILMKR